MHGRSRTAASAARTTAASRTQRQTVLPTLWRGRMPCCGASLRALSTRSSQEGGNATDAVQRSSRFARAGPDRRLRPARLGTRSAGLVRWRRAASSRRYSKKWHAWSAVGRPRCQTPDLPATRKLPCPKSWRRVPMRTSSGSSEPSWTQSSASSNRWTTTQSSRSSRSAGQSERASGRSCVRSSRCPCRSARLPRPGVWRSSTTWP
mmetsp:Transcript_22786/g.58123  ORF Transcript_22786/g.58123 Transcript_22786/m.58123 type:complete len:206 (+) Transcript_22786:257-874(+)